MSNDSRIDDLCSAVQFLAQGLRVLADGLASEHSEAARWMAAQAERTVERVLLAPDVPTSTLFPTLAKLL